MKNYIIVHGISGLSDAGWAVWLRDELVKMGEEVMLPVFPARDDATLEKWEAIFDGYKNQISQDTIIVAHSLGTIFTVNYLAKNNLKIKAAIYVSGMSRVDDIGENLEKSHRENLQRLTKPFLPSKENKEKFKKLVSKTYCIFSDNDHALPLKNLEKFAVELDAVQMLLPGRGHFGKRMNCQQIPEVLELVKSLK